MNAMRSCVPRRLRFAVVIAVDLFFCCVAQNKSRIIYDFFARVVSYGDLFARVVSWDDLYPMSLRVFRMFRSDVFFLFCSCGRVYASCPQFSFDVAVTTRRLGSFEG